MLRFIVLFILVVLFGCSDSDFDKCLKAEKGKLFAKNQFILKYKENNKKYTREDMLKPDIAFYKGFVSAGEPPIECKENRYGKKCKNWRKVAYQLARESLKDAGFEQVHVDLFKEVDFIFELARDDEVFSKMFDNTKREADNDIPFDDYEKKAENSTKRFLKDRELAYNYITKKIDETAAEICNQRGLYK